MNFHPSKQFGLNDIPESWDLTTVLNKGPFRQGWQDREPLSRDELAALLEHGECVWSDSRAKKRNGNGWWLAQWNGYGLRTGRWSGGLLAIDVDGPTAAELYSLMAGKATGETDTPSWTSGKPGRRQEVYQLSEKLQQRLEAANFTHYALKEWQGFKCQVEGDEQLDFRYDRCQSVLPPSVHPSTRAYRWISNPKDIPVADAPEWLESFLFAHCARIEAEQQQREIKRVERQLKREQYQQLPPSANRVQSESFVPEAFLNAINPDLLGWYEWRDCLLAAHDSDLDEGTVRSWSARSSKHTDHGFDAVWNSIKGNQGLTAGTLYYYAKEQGYKPSRRNPSTTAETDRGEELVNKARIDKSIKLPSDQKAVERTAERMVRNALEARKAPTLATPVTNTDCTAIVRWKAPIDPIGRLVVTEKTTPTYAEWEAQGKPRLHIEGDPVPVLLKMVELGYETVLLDDIVGGGKTHSVGKFMQAWQGLQQWKPVIQRERAVYYAADYKNPSTPTLETIPETPTGGALNHDHEHLTPSGKPHRKRAPRGTANPDIASLCVEDENVQAARAKGMDLYRGTEAPICQGCRVGTRNCPYLREMAKAQEESVIRSHLSKGGSGRVAFVDEAGRTIQATKQITVDSRHLDQEIAWLSTYYPTTYRKLADVITPIKKGIDRAIAESGRHGLTHAELMVFLPLRDELETLFWNAAGDDLLQRCDDPWDWPSISSIANQILGTLQDAKQSMSRGDTAYRAQLISKTITPGILPRLIKLIAGESGDVAITPNGQLTFSYRDRRHQRTLSNFDTVFLMDATPDPIDLARRLGVQHQDITRVSWTTPTFENLTIKIVDGIGKATQQRRNEGQYSEQQRITRLVEAIASSGNLTGLLDLKAHMGNYSDIPIVRGHQFAHSRGSNEYKECEQMVIIAGNARENLGASLAQWHLLTGEAATVETASPAFWTWVERRSQANLLQGNGRTRAQHRPNEPITHYIVGEVSETDIKAMQHYFTSCTIERVQAYDICPEAATRGYQSDRAICEAMWVATQRGEDATITQIADASCMTKGAVSKRVAKMLETGGYRAFRQSFQTLYKALYSERKLSDLASEHLFLAAEYLPELAQEFNSRQRSTDDIAGDVIYTIQALGDDALNVLGACDSPTLATLLGALSVAMPMEVTPMMGVLQAMVEASP